MVVGKVKAHCTAEDIDTVIRWQDFAGNSFADKLADLAADLAAVPSSVAAAFKAIDATCWKVQSRIAAVICAASNREADEHEARSHKANKAIWQRETLAMGAEDLLARERRHEEEGSLPEPPPLESAELPAPQPLRLGGTRSTAVHPSHRLVFKRGVVWRSKCGAHGTVRGF